MTTIEVKNIGVRAISGKGVTMTPSKWFWVDPENGEFSEMFDSSDEALANLKARLVKNDKTGETAYIAEVKFALRAERNIGVASFATKKK